MAIIKIDEKTLNEILEAIPKSDKYLVIGVLNAVEARQKKLKMVI